MISDLELTMSVVSEELDGGTEVPRDREIDSEDDDLDPRLLQAIRLHAEAIINRMPVSHNYGRTGNGEKALLRWLLAIASGALLLALAGSWSMYGAVSHVSQQVTDYHDQDMQNSERNHQDIQRINDYLEKRYGN